MSVPPPTMIELRCDAASGDGASVGRDASGRAVFARGALPGELVRVALEQEKKRFAKGRVVDVLEPAADRIEPACQTSRLGCGGCDLNHASIELQKRMKLQVVADALERIAKVNVPDQFSFHGAASSRAYRTTVRAAVRDGRAGYRRHGSHEVVAADECLVAHPLVEELLVRCEWGSADEVMLRASIATGERLAVVRGSTNGIVVPDDVAVIAESDLGTDHDPSVTESVAGRDWRVSAGSFFQSGPEAAAALVDVVASLVGDLSGRRFVDAYAGVGLFAGTVGATASHVTAIEAAPSSVADARINLEASVDIHECRVEDWLAAPADVIVADPARSGLGKDAVQNLLRAEPSQIVLVSCDAGSMGRDIGSLSQEGFQLERIEVVDAFADTSHVEVVSSLTR